MTFIKYSESTIDTVYTEKDEMLKEIASKSICCAKCGSLLNIEDEGPLVTCNFCGYQTPRMVSQPEEE
jgi:DNA-directed RNA polymerase subunit RPC12/RpoP